MSRSFRFQALDGSHPTLQAIDDMICVDVGITPSAEDWSIEYQILTWMGLCMLMRYGGSYVDEDIVTLWCMDHETEPTMAALYYDYLAGRKYKYEAWG